MCTNIPFADFVCCSINSYATEVCCCCSKLRSLGRSHVGSLPCQWSEEQKRLVDYVICTLATSACLVHDVKDTGRRVQNGSAEGRVFATFKLFFFFLSFFARYKLHHKLTEKLLCVSLMIPFLSMEPVMSLRSAWLGVPFKSFMCHSCTTGDSVRSLLWSPLKTSLKQCLRPFQHHLGMSALMENFERQALFCTHCQFKGSLLPCFIVSTLFWNNNGTVVRGSVYK